MSEELKKVPWVGAETLSWFYSWCREHGISGDNEKFRRGIIAGIFQPGAYAVQDPVDPSHYWYYIFPARLERWAEELAIDYR